MTLGAVVQARMRSTRLPGKVLRELGGRAILERLLDRLSRARSLERIVVATSVDPSDDAVADLCDRLAVACHRGPLEDVAVRFADACERYQLSAFVRVSADSPFLDPAIVDLVVAALDPGVDVATNVHPRTFPRGQSVEAVDAKAFRRALALMGLPGDREHVTPAMYRNADRFTIRNVLAATDDSDLRMVIDDAADLERAERAVARMSKDPAEHGLGEMIRIYRDLPPSSTSG